MNYFQCKKINKHQRNSFIIFLIIILISNTDLWGQNVSISATGTPPHPSAGLEINFNNRGLLIPRLITAQRNNINNPAVGLLIYNIDCENFSYYNGIKWTPFNSSIGLAAPGTITGQNSVSTGQTGLTYSIQAVPLATYYNWTIPAGASIQSGQGTTSITVDFGSSSGNICVTAENDCGTSSASCLLVTVTFTCGTNSVQDADGNWYTTVQIGTQCWMAENLNIGMRIPGSNNQTGNDTIEKYCYDDNESNCDTDGGLYQWDEMMQGATTEGSQGVCPTGWHIPTDEEWCIMENSVDNTIASPCSGMGWRGFDGGTELKQGGSVGFEAILAGERVLSGTFQSKGSNTVFWTSTENGMATMRIIDIGRNDIMRGDAGKTDGFSVRCLKDN
ncbi:MAG: FISUMP domain-containing protein [Bacteroidota bacterium]